MFPLDDAHFPLDPPQPVIDTKTDVDNPTANRRGISGYLGDPFVAERIHDALNRP